MENEELNACCILHCCQIHGCKYSDPDCPVVAKLHGGVTGNCEYCAMDERDGVNRPSAPGEIHGKYQTMLMLSNYATEVNELRAKNRKLKKKVKKLKKRLETRDEVDE